MDAEEKSRSADEGLIAFGASLSATIRAVGKARIVALNGSVEMDDAERFGMKLPGLVGPDTPHLILDLARLDFISSVGISAIVAAHRRAKTFNGSLQLVSPKTPIAKLFDVTRLSELLPVRPTVQAALEASTRPS